MAGRRAVSGGLKVQKETQRDTCANGKSVRQANRWGGRQRLRICLEAHIRLSIESPIGEETVCKIELVYEWTARLGDRAVKC